METNIKFNFNGRKTFSSDTGPAVGQNASAEPTVDVVFVSQDIGSDANPGTEVSPLLTLYDAINVASEANIVLIDGDFPYYGSINLRGKVLFARAGVTWRLGNQDTFGGSGSQKTGIWTAGEDNTVFTAISGVSPSQELQLNTIQQGEKLVKSVVLNNQGPVINAAFPELTFNNLTPSTSLPTLGGAATVYEGNKVFHFFLRCAAPTYGYAADESAVIMLNTDEDLNIINYYFLSDAFDFTGTFVDPVNEFIGFPSGAPLIYTPVRLDGLHLGDETGGQRAFFQKVVQTNIDADPGPGLDLQPSHRYVQYIMLEENTGPGDPNYLLRVTTPGESRSGENQNDPSISNNISGYGLTPSQYVGSSVQWNERGGGGTQFELSEIETELIAAAGVYASLSGSLQNLLKGVHFYEWAWSYAGFNGPVQPFSTLVSFDTSMGATNRGVYSNFFWHNPFIPENYRGTVGHILGTDYSGVQSQLDPVFFNGTVKNLFLDLADQNFPTGQQFGARFSNFGSVMLSGKVDFCEVEGMAGQLVFLEYETIFTDGPQAGPVNIEPEGYVVARGEIESCLTANFQTVSTWRNDQPSVLITLPISPRNTVAVICGRLTISAGAFHCSMLQCGFLSFIDNNSNYTFFGIAAAEFGQPEVLENTFSPGGTITIEDSVIQESASQGVINNFIVQNNVLKSKPFFRSTINPFNLRLSAIGKGDVIDSPAIGFTSTVSAFGGNREAGAYDDASELTEYFEQVTILAPWEVDIKEEQTEKINKLESGARPSMALSKASLLFKFKWSLHITEAERQILHRIVTANDSRILYFPRPIANPSLFLEGYIKNATDLSPEKAIFDKFSNKLFLDISFTAPDNSQDINAYI